MTESELSLEQDSAAAWVLSTPQGRAFWFRIVHGHDLGMLHRSSRVPGDPEGTARNEGRQDLARDLLALARRTNETLFEKMMQEAYGRSRRVESARVPPDGDASP